MTGSIELTTPLSFLRHSYMEPGENVQSHFDRLAPKDKPIVCVFNGTPLLRRYWDVTIITEEDSVQFVVMPQGGQDNSFTKILRSVALIALSIAAPIVGSAIGAALGGVFASALGISLISAGLVLAGAFLINALLPPGGGSAAQNATASPTYSLGAQGNTARLMEPIPRLYGRHVFYPDFASLPWVTYEGNEQYLYQLFCLGVGHYDVEQVRIEDTVLWTSSGGMTGTFTDVQLEIIPPGGNVTLFPAAVITSVEVGGQELDTSWMGPYIANPSDRATDRLQVDLIYPRGIYYANDEGGTSSYSVSVIVQVRPVNALGVPTGGFVTLETFTLSAATPTPQRVTRNYAVSLGRYEVQITRADAKNTDTRYANDVVWGSLRAFIPDDNVFPDVTLMAVVIRATNQLTDQSSRRFNVIETAKLPIWNGTTWSAPTATRSIAWAAADILRNEIYGAGLGDARIDLEALLDLASIWSTRGDKFDGVFDRKQSLWTSVGQCLLAGRTQPLLIAGRVSFVRDQPAEIVRGVLTPRNIIRGSFETTHILYDDDSPDAVIVEFIDERTWKQNEVLCKVPGSTEENPARVTTFGVVDRSHAFREGMYQAATNLYRRVFASLTTELEGRLLIRGDAVAVSHDLVKWGLSAEVIGWTEGTRTVQLSEPMADDTTVIGFSDRRGRLWGPVEVASVTDEGYSVILDATDLALIESEQGDIPIYLEFDQEPTRSVAGSLEGYMKRFKVISSKPDRSGAVQMVLTNDDPRVYTADTADLPDEVSPYGPGVAPDAPVMTGLVVSQDPASPANPVLLNASWNAAPGATSYLIEGSTDGVSWATVYSGSSTFCSFSMEAGPVYVRGSAIGAIKGPLAYPSPNPTTYGTPSLLPSQPQNLEAEADTSAGVVNVDWTSAARATSYRVDVYSIGSGTYDALEMTRSTSGTTVLFTSTDVAAAGGPWDTIKVFVTPINVNGEGLAASTLVSGISMDPPGVVYLVTAYTGIEINAQWSSVIAASSYVAELWQGGVLKASFTVTSTNLLVTSDTIVSAGGPWRALELRVKAQNGTLISSPTVLSITDPAPAVPANIVTASPSPGEVTVGWDAVSGAGVTAYVLYASTTSGFTPAPGNEAYRGLSLGVSITGLTPTDVLYFRLRAEDNYAGHDGYNMSTQFSRLVS